MSNWKKFTRFPKDAFRLMPKINWFLQDLHPWYNNPRTRKLDLLAWGWIVQECVSRFNIHRIMMLGWSKTVVFDLK